MADGERKAQQACEPGRRYGSPWCCTHDLPLVCAGAPVEARAVGGQEEEPSAVWQMPEPCATLVGKAMVLEARAADMEVGPERERFEARAAEHRRAADTLAAALRVEGVVFILRDEAGRVLMERCPKKAARHGGEWFIPGGRLEAGEDAHDALMREMFEELGRHPLAAVALPIIDACGGPGWPPFLMQPFLVTAWSGAVPTHVLDHPDVPLRWVPWEEAVASPSAVVRAMLAAAVRA